MNIFGRNGTCTQGQLQAIALTNSSEILPPGAGVDAQRLPPVLQSTDPAGGCAAFQGGAGTLADGSTEPIG